MIKFIKRLLGKDMSKKRPLKIQNYNGSFKIGVVASSLSELREKIHKKLAVSANFTIIEEDGTEICDNDYFCLLKPQTRLIVLREGEIWSQEKENKTTRIEKALKSLLDSNQMKEIIDGVYNLLKTEKHPQKQALLGTIAESAQSGVNIDANSRSDHPEWFEGLPLRYKCKEQFMKDNSRRRIRSYYYVASEHIKISEKKHQKAITKKILQEVLFQFNKQLKSNDGFGDYFARSSTVEGAKFCDDKGWFRCEGPYDKIGCGFADHFINPYSSWQNRVVFSTWNLDHRIEKSREIMPQLIRAIDNIPKSKELNWDYFFDLLFTRKNLKLVHIACHDKGEHTIKCDVSKFYL